MESSWRVLSLADAPVEIIDGDRGKNYPKQQDFLDEGFCLFLNAGNVTSTGFRFDKCSFITREKDSALRKGKLARHDIVLTTRGTVGNVAYYDEEVSFHHMRINSGMVIFRAHPTAVAPSYFYHFLRSRLFDSQVASLRTGSAQPQLPIRDIRRIELPLPPLQEQKRIAAVLSTFDDKIELNRRMNETLEAIARAIFKSWFIDFDPVHAKAAGEQPYGMDAETAALFPDSFTDSQLGPIPAGWRVSNIYDLAQVRYGAPYSSRLFNAEGGGLPLIRNRDLKTHSPQVFTAEIHPKETIVNPGDIIVGMDGEFRVHHWQGTKALLNQRVCMFVPQQDVPKAFLEMTLVRPLEFYERTKTGTTVIHLGKRDIDRIRVLCPVSPVLSAFSQAVEPLHQLRILNSQQSRTLVKLRDTLLPRLISGRLRVPIAERIMENVI